MSPKLKFALICRCSDRGFALPVAVAMGFIILLVAATLIMRSQGDGITAAAQMNTAQSLSVAEGGIVRSISNLKNTNNGTYLQLNYDPLNTATSKTYLGANGILDDGDGEASAVDQWTTLPGVGGCTASGSLPSGLASGSIGSGSYQIKAYRYRDPDGTANNGDEVGDLLLQGQQGSGTSQVQVTVPIVRSAVTGSFPGLYASHSINLDGNDILKVSTQTGSVANVICKNCTVPNPSTQCSGGQPTLAGKEAAIGKNNQGTVEKDIFITDPQLPPVPTAPATACSAISGANCQIALGTPSGGMALPRPTDVSNRTTWSIGASEPYHYVITGNWAIGNNIVSVDTTNAPVYIYVSGNVTMNGGGGIAHSGSPERLRLYGRPADNNSANDQTITISGGASASRIFIYAPDATVGINGGSNSPDILGAVWAKNWDGSAGNNADIQVPDNMPTLLGGSFSAAGMQAITSGSPSSWQRQSTN